jgi:hypothetical protein
MDDNPNLLQLRALQTFGDSSNNTLVLGMPNGAVPIPTQNPKNAAGPRKEPLEEKE